MDLRLGNTQIEVSQHPGRFAIIPKPGIAKRERARGVFPPHPRGHGLVGIHQRLPHAQRFHIEDLSHLPIYKLKRTGCIVNHRAWGMRSHHHGAPQLAVDAKEGMKEIALGHRIELRSRLIEQ